MSISSPNLNSLGIIAGGGHVPAEIASAVTQRGGSVYIISINEKPSRDLFAYPNSVISIGQIGRMLRLLRQNKCRSVVIAGHITRPNILKLRMDLGFFRYFRTIVSLFRGGDDCILRKIVSFFERQGFIVVGIPAVAPELVVKRGLLVGKDLASNDMQDVACGYELIQKLGSFDIGQAVVVRNKRLLAIEGVDGTDAMLGRIIMSSNTFLAASGALVKATKPGQELRIDLPTIGVTTVKACKKSGLRTIALEAEHTVIAEREQTINLANSFGISILGVQLAQNTLNSRDNIKIEASKLACLTLKTADSRHLLDACNGLMAGRIISAYATSPSIVVVRQHILAVNVGETLENFIYRATRLRQWGNTGELKRQGLLVLSSYADVTQRLPKILSDNNFAGIAIDCRRPLPTEFLKEANRLELFVLVCK
ncbi:MAG: UDP-2,3-diacylglucosamine diphosphatase LpxI [Hyphomicrobiaceae bacterium]|nr:UDP-2,3-diacylglucosamine diphosphatase LpxI [Hyphomicrobiaceae bacterium]